MTVKIGVGPSEVGGSKPIKNREHQTFSHTSMRFSFYVFHAHSKPHAQSHAK